MCTGFVRVTEARSSCSYSSTKSLSSQWPEVSQLVFCLDSFDDLDDVLVFNRVILANFLWLMLDAVAPHQGIFELSNDGPVNLVAKVLNSSVLGVQYHRRAVVQELALGLRVNPSEVEVLPHLLQEVVKVPLVIC